MWIDDEVIKCCEQQLTVRVWQPENHMVVLGRSNQPEREVYVDRCRDDQVPVLKRYGGGGTVLLHPGCLVISCGAWVSSPYDNDRYFRKLNQAVISTIQQRVSGLDLMQKGFSDIVVGSRKIAGTSLFRSRNYLLYQASLLLDAELELIERYLRHPSREPDYRASRRHRDFIAGLHSFLGDHSLHDRTLWLEHFQAEVPNHIQRELANDLIQPLAAHMSHLRKRAGLQS